MCCPIVVRRIVTQADTLEELYTNVCGAAACHAGECGRPESIRLRFIKVER